MEKYAPNRTLPQSQFRLEGANIYLQPIRESDRSAFFSLVNENLGKLKYSFPVLLSSCETKQSTSFFITEQIALWSQQQKFSFCIFDRQTDQMVGYIFLKGIDWQVPKCEVGYFVDQEHYNKGITTAAVEQVCTFGFEHLKMEKMYLRILIDNNASKRVAIKTGFVCEAILKKDFRSADGTLQNVEYFAKFKSCDK